MRATLCVVFTLCACNDKGSDSSDEGGDTVDLDADGYSVPDDCDDADAEIHPDASEVCDGADNDCDGTIDVGASDAVDYWVDADSDGYGGGTPTATCAPHAGSVANGDDCDDARKDVNPEGVEVCDDLDTDEDCDTLIDDDDDSLDAKTATTTLYPDGDKDTYGDAAVPVASCGPRAGHIEDGTDCDDTDGAVNPAAEEVCGDGVDNNCDTAGCDLTGSVASTDANARLVGDVDYRFIGDDIDPAGDFNGDGVGDVLVGSWYLGTAFVFFGPVADTTMSSADAAFGGPSIGANGAWNAPLGDQDGDGFDDLLVAAYQYEGPTSKCCQGQIYVIQGPVTGTHLSDEVARATITGNDFNYLGWNVSAGDVSGDGVPDVVAPAPGDWDDAGGVYTYFGPITGDLGTGDADASIAGLYSGDWTGGATAANGDVNGDGFDDLLISAEGADYDPGGVDDGLVFLFYGPVSSGSSDVSSADVRMHGAPNGSGLGWASSLNGDVDGDGIDDVGVSAAALAAGTAGDVWLLYADTLASGDLIDLAKADARLTGETVYDLFGATMDMGSDIDSDGFADVVVGATYFGAAPAPPGRAYVFNGPLSGGVAAAKADFTITGIDDEFLGHSAKFLGDVSGDGYDDLGVSANYASAGGTYRGAVGIWFGGGL